MNKYLGLEEIVAGCKANERLAQEQLFKLYYGKMSAVCMRYVKDKDSVQEYVQEGFIKIFDKLQSFDDKGSFEGWMRRIFVNTTIDALRKSKKNPMLVEHDWQFGDANSDDSDSKEFDEQVILKSELAMEAIQNLSPAYKMVFNLYVFENYSHKQIAEILEISEGTSKSNFAKAKINLQKMLTQKFVNLD